MPDTGRRGYQKRVYGHSCQTCRERKTKCEVEDEWPCKQCRTLNVPCKPAETIRHKKQRVDDRDEGRSGSSYERDQELVDIRCRLKRLEELAQIAEPSPSSETIPFPPPGQTETTLDEPRYDLGSASRPVYTGETSMFDDQPRPSNVPSPVITPDGHESMTEERLRAYARLRHKYVSPDEGEALMDAYFTWASPIYAVVHRPLFIRDMALKGPYFSDFLLIVIYITGIRLTYGMEEQERLRKGEAFVDIAMGMLGSVTMQGSSICTIQGLLGLAGRQAAVGKTSQAWMLTGMALRMMQDMGLHLPLNSETSQHRFSSEERDMRNRLYWSAYCWDKTMSLSLGREPSLLCRAEQSPGDLPEDPDDLAEWVPHLPPGTALPAQRPYPRTLLRKSFTLRYSCTLNIILESVMTNMYSPDKASPRSYAFMRTAVDRLEHWRRNLPSDLKIESSSPPSLSPPANIVILNLLYHTVKILIYRPLLNSEITSAIAQSALQQCRSAAIESHAIFSLWGQTFGHFCHHYLFLYCCFISAGVDVLLIRAGSASIREEALRRIHLSIDILELAAVQGPAIRDGIRTIKAQLDRETRAQPYVSPNAPPPWQPTPAPPDGTHPSMTQTLMADLFTSQPLRTNDAPQTSWEPMSQNIWSDSQGLMELLGAAPISTEDPFAFGSNQDWNFINPL